MVSRTIALWTLALLAVAPPIVAAPGRRVAADPLLPLLQEEDAQSRAQVLARLEEERRPPCQALRRYATSPNSRVRESAVRIMDAAACSDFEAYSGYLLDNAAGVVDALIDASRRRVMADAVPFLLGCLSDRRRIVTQEGAWSIGEKAQRALMVVTCQSFHYDPAAPRDDQRDAITRWRQWFLARRKLPRDEWVQEGIERGRDYAGRDYGPHRLEGLRLLALIGPPALPALREVLARRPGDLSAEVVCLPDEPPRPGDVVPCALVVRNASKRPLAIAPPPDGPQVRLSPDGARFEDDGSPARRAAPPGGESRDALGALADRLVDLAPGEVRRFEFGAGPVLTAGHYRLHVELDDLAARLPESQKTGSAPRTAAASGAIEADTMVRFEQ